MPASLTSVLFLSSILLIPAFGQGPAPTVTITHRAPIEVLTADGNIGGVIEATVGTHYTLVGVKQSNVLLQDASGKQYLIAINCTDYNPPAPPPPPVVPSEPVPTNRLNPVPAPDPQPAEIVAAPQAIKPGEIWPDDRGKHIQAHGGGIIKLGDIYYWFGEDRSPDNDPNLRYVACYSSTDLANWKFRNQIVKADDPARLGPGWILERPKVFYNANTEKYVMYAHMDDKKYGTASVGVFTCDTVDGDYQFIKIFRPLGEQSRDIGQFIDDDGTAYLIFEDRPHGFHIAKLSDDYMTVEKDVHLFTKEEGGALEGGALIHYNGLYYIVGSKMTGWAPNPNKYASAPSLEGPWTEFKDIAPPEKNTYNSQSTFVLKVIGSKTTSVIFMADWWVHTEHPLNLSDARYIWMPVEIGDGKFWVPQPKKWTIDVHTGEVSLN